MRYKSWRYIILYCNIKKQIATPCYIKQQRLVQRIPAAARYLIRQEVNFLWKMILIAALRD
jgi:hypothetical protein